MKIDITGKQFKVVARLREHIEEHLEKLNRYDSNIISAHVVLKTQKYMNTAEVTVKASHFQFFGIGTTDDNMFSAVDLAIHRVQAQLKKHREKFKGLKKRRRRVQGSAGRKVSPENSEVVASEVFSLKPTSLKQAAQQLKISKKEFIIFRNSKSNKINVLYKRPDGHHSLVEPGS